MEEYDLQKRKCEANKAIQAVLRHSCPFTYLLCPLLRLYFVVLIAVRRRMPLHIERLYVTHPFTHTYRQFNTSVKREMILEHSSMTVVDVNAQLISLCGKHTTFNGSSILVHSCTVLIYSFVIPLMVMSYTHDIP